MPSSSPVLERVGATITLSVKELVQAVKEALTAHGVATSAVTANHVKVQSDGMLSQRRH